MIKIDSTKIASHKTPILPEKLRKTSLAVRLLSTLRRSAPASWSLRSAAFIQSAQQLARRSSIRSEPTSAGAWIRPHGARRKGTDPTKRDRLRSGRACAADDGRARRRRRYASEPVSLVL